MYKVLIVLQMAMLWICFIWFDILLLAVVIQQLISNRPRCGFYGVFVPMWFLLMVNCLRNWRDFTLSRVKDWSQYILNSKLYLVSYLCI